MAKKTTKRKARVSENPTPAAPRGKAPKNPPLRKASPKPKPARKPAVTGANGTSSRHAQREAFVPDELLDSSVQMPMIVVDAFTRRQFHGNSAAVVLCDQGFPPEELMQNIAAENNLSETAFIVLRRAEGSTAKADIRWFSPTTEIDLCGHATLAAAHALYTHGQLQCQEIQFRSQTAGVLPVHRMEHLYVLDFPATYATPLASSHKLHKELAAGLGRAPTELYLGRDIMAVFENKRDVHEVKPDFAALAAIRSVAHQGVVVTAPGAGHDFVSRCFYPKAGINEDPVTGSAHCMLTPYWATRLGKAHLSAHQVSRRGGELFCELKLSPKGDRVLLGGHAVTVSIGALTIE